MSAICCSFHATDELCFIVIKFSKDTEGSISSPPFFLVEQSCKIPETFMETCKRFINRFIPFQTPLQTTKWLECHLSQNWKAQTQFWNVLVHESVKIGDEFIMRSRNTWVWNPDYSPLRVGSNVWELGGSRVEWRFFRCFDAVCFSCQKNERLLDCPVLFRIMFHWMRGFFSIFERSSW